MRKCEESEVLKILDYISAEPEMNLFLFGDIEVYGISSEIVSLYVSDSSSESLYPYEFIILKYYDNYLLYSRDLAYPAAKAATFLSGRTIECIRGKTDLIARLAPYFPEYAVNSNYMCRCNKEEFVSKGTGLALDLRQLQPADSPLIIELYTQITEFSKTYLGKEESQIKQTAENLSRGSLAFGVFDNDRLVSIACTTAANSISAMVAGVATLPAFRRRGLGTAVVSRLCEASFSEEKQFLCLTYNNPGAGMIYHRIGFQEIGEYALFR